jgi:hypothetical protein
MYHYGLKYFQLSSCRRKEEVCSSEAASSPMVSTMGSSSDPVLAENTAMCKYVF